MKSIEIKAVIITSIIGFFLWLGIWNLYNLWVKAWEREVRQEITIYHRGIG